MYKKKCQKMLENGKKCARRRKYEKFPFALSLGTKRRVKVPFESLSVEPRRSKRLKENSVKVFDSASDYFVHSQQTSIFKEIDSNYEKAISKLNRTTFCALLQLQAPMFTGVKQKVSKNIKSLIKEIDSALDGDGPPEAHLVPEKEWVYATPFVRKENYNFEPTANFYSTPEDFVFNFTPPDHPLLSS